MRVSEGFLGRSTVAYDQLFAKELLSGDEVCVYEIVGEETESAPTRGLFKWRYTLVVGGASVVGEDPPGGDREGVTESDFGFRRRMRSRRNKSKTRVKN